MKRCAPSVRLVFIIALAVASLCPLRTARSQNPDSVKFETERLAEGVYVIYGLGGNIGVGVGNDAVFVIDDQFAPLTPKVLASIRAITDKPVRFVVNTHWHFDHTGGNEHMGQAGALIIAHDNVRRRMSTRQFIEFMKREEPAAPAGALPVITFSDTVTFHLNGDEIVAMHMSAAHTDGDAAIYFRRANVLHTGDVFVRYGYPLIDLSSGGSLSGMVRAVDRMLALINDSTRVIPGHGRTSTRTDLREFREMLVTVRDRVRRRVRAGATLAQILAAKPTADLDKRWNGTFVKADDFVRFAYEDARRR